MTILPDWEIAQEIKISPYSLNKVRPNIISYGVSSYGYDIRVGRNYKVMCDRDETDFGIIDPKKTDWYNLFKDKKDVDYCLIPGNSFALAETVETFEIPRNILAVCVGKSTYARCGIIVNITPLEPEWKGKITLEISNTTPYPAKIYSEEGIAQILFFKASHGCMISYADKKGKYQDQEGLTLPKIS